MIDAFDVKKAYAVLELENKIIGVKRVFSKEEFERYAAKAVKYPLAYCVAVKLAMNGLALKMTGEESRCGGSTRALGLSAPSESFFDGSDGKALGLYASHSIASDVARQMKLCPNNTYGLIIKRLEQFEDEPDVVIMAGISYTAMRIVQGYSYMYGLQPNFNILGNQAICVECTAYPIMTDRINVSLLCSGTRFLAKWEKNILAVGMPYRMFGNVIEGVRLTANAVESNGRKKVIRADLTKLGYDSREITDDSAYYLRLEREKQKGR